MHRVPLLLIGALATVLLVVAPAAAEGVREEKLRDASWTVARPEAGLRLLVTIDVGGVPSSMVMAAGSLWVSLGVDGIARIDPASNQIVARIRPGGVGLAAGFGSIWAIDVFFDELLRIDPETNRITDRIPVGGLPSGIAIGHGSVWVANQLDSTVSRVSPTSGETIATIDVGGGAVWPGAILSSPAGIWVVAEDGMVVKRIRPETAAVDLRISIPYARTLAAALGSVWVGVANSSSLVRIRQGTAVRVATAGRRANGYGPQLAGGRSLWLAVPGSVARARPLHGRQLDLPLPASRYPSPILVAGDVWVADQTRERILRLADAGRAGTP